MEEIWELQKKLAAVQLVDSAYKLNERNCVEIISKLVSSGLLEVVYTLNAKEYLTPDQLKSEIYDEILSSGGRVSLTDIQTVVNVDINHIERLVKVLLEESDEIMLIAGELITSWYLDNLTEEVNDTVLEKGFVSVSTLATKFGIPFDITLDMVQRRVGGKIKAILKRGVLYTVAYERRQYAKLRGYCIGATKSISIPIISSSCNIEEEEVLEMIPKLIAQKQLLGILKGREYIPKIYSHLQRSTIDYYFKTNNYIEMTRLRKFQISKPLEFVQITFPEAMALKTCIINKELLAPIESEVQLLVRNTVSIVNKKSDISTDPSTGSKQEQQQQQHIQEATLSSLWLHLHFYLPTILEESDFEMIIKVLLNKLQKEQPSLMKGVIILNQTYIIHDQLLKYITDKFAGESTIITTEICEKLRLIQSKNTGTAVSFSSTSSSSATSSNTKGNQSSMVKSNNIDTDLEEEDDDEDYGRKQSGNKKKGKAGKDDNNDNEKDSNKKKNKSKKESKSSTSAVTSTSKKSSDSSSSSDPKVLLAPYLLKPRRISLMKGWLRSLLLPPSNSSSSSGRNDDTEEEEEDVEALDKLLSVVWNHIESVVMEKMISAVSRGLESLQQGDLVERRRREADRDAKFENEWLELLAVSKGLQGLLESDISESDSAAPSPSSSSLSKKKSSNASNDIVTNTGQFLEEVSQLNAYTLQTRGVRILVVLTSFVCWETSGTTSPFHDAMAATATTASSSSSASAAKLDVLDIAGTVEKRQQLLKGVPKEASQLLNKLWTIVCHSFSISTNSSSTSSSSTKKVTGAAGLLSEFIDLIDTSGTRVLQLIVKKFDKKKNKQITFAIRQSLMDTLRLTTTVENATVATNPEKIMILALGILFHQITGSILDIPPNSSGVEIVIKITRSLCIGGDREETCLALANFWRQVTGRSQRNQEAVEGEEGKGDLPVYSDLDKEVADSLEVIKDLLLSKK